MRLEEKNVSNKLRERIMDILYTGRQRGKVLTKKGVRQGCPLSPMLFNVIIADLEKELGKGR